MRQWRPNLEFILRCSSLESRCPEGWSTRGYKHFQASLANAHAHLHIHVFGISNNALGKHRTKGDSATPSSPMRTIKLWHLLPVFPALLHSSEDHITGRESFPLLERGDIVLQLPWLMASREGWTCVSGLQLMKPRRKLSSSGRHQNASTRGGVTGAARTPLGEPRPPGTKETWEMLKAKFPTEEASFVTAAAVVVAASAMESEGVFLRGARTACLIRKWLSKLLTTVAPSQKPGTRNNASPSFSPPSGPRLTARYFELASDY